MPDVVVKTPRGQMPCYLAVPPKTGPTPGVVVLHDLGGMSQDHRNQAGWLAEAGFLALAIDLYYLGGILRCMRSIMRDLTARSGPTYEDVEACRNWLALRPDCTGKIGVIGFCMGGGFALLLVSGYGFSAASINYGGKLPADIVGRTKELIIRFGFNVYPAEVEGVLNRHPAVTQSAVIGTLVEETGEQEIVAFVQPRLGSKITAHELGWYVAQYLATYKRPTHIFLMSELPRALSGKILKEQLAKMLESEAGIRNGAW